MKRYVQIILSDEDMPLTAYDEFMKAQSRIFWAGWIEQIPREIKKARGGFRWLQNQTNVEGNRLRDLLHNLGMNPNK